MMWELCLYHSIPLPSASPVMKTAWCPGYCPSECSYDSRCENCVHINITSPHSIPISSPSPAMKTAQCPDLLPIWMQFVIMWESCSYQKNGCAPHFPTSKSNTLFPAMKTAQCLGHHLNVLITRTAEMLSISIHSSPSSPLSPVALQISSIM